MSRATRQLRRHLPATPPLPENLAMQWTTQLADRLITAMRSATAEQLTGGEA